MNKVCEGRNDTERIALDHEPEIKTIIKIYHISLTWNHS